METGNLDPFLDASQILHRDDDFSNEFLTNNEDLSINLPAFSSLMERTVVGASDSEDSEEVESVRGQIRQSKEKLNQLRNLLNRESSNQQIKVA